ncbi:polysaccharide biosynthesis tyrosine autokinase [Cupriavidus malaysiensis]|uniref:Tyrosine protein kinase n=1 Tax=Cupriavidus malaysiensis TaxID=367825 RepID=A0ABM6F9F3_9BURK|nr:polysaccharide biosynthesis tyrosine autokinase [Cupriavidus malaysiensis]AOZ08307.1 tyrosine protein kinase [Cupriavidus malaysiensis]
MSTENATGRDYEPTGQDSRPIDLTECLDVLVRYRWTFLLMVGVIACSGLAYAFLAKPVYRTDILIQVEEGATPSSTAKLVASVSPALDVKPAAAAEIELLRSRMVVGKAVDSLHLNIEAAPRYFPLLGTAIARYNPVLSEPGLLGWGGFAWGAEAISVARLDVPVRVEGRPIMVTALASDQFRAELHSEGVTATGTVGTPLVIPTPGGPVTILISQLDGRPGAKFVVRHIARSVAIDNLQNQLVILERGKQSGVIGISLEGSSAERTAAILNAIGTEYVDQNVRRKAAEAEKSLEFLEAQLPLLKQQVENAESRYNAMRNKRGTIDLSEESKLVLTQSVQIQTRLQELRQKRQELIARFTPNHPIIAILDGQIASLSSQLNGVTGKIEKLPEVEQDVLRLMRDVKVSTDLYQSLLNDVQQLRLVRASKIGTSRLVDMADVPLYPVRPKRLMIGGAAIVLGLVAGVLAVVLRRTLDGGITDADEIERLTGMTVYCTIPFSPQQGRRQGDAPSRGLLARDSPDDPALESLRGFRTALQFALLNSRNRVVLVTGPAPDVGKSFVCSNFAAVMASSGRRVVLVDADLRRGGLNHRFSTHRSPGLSEYLAGTALDAVLQRDVLPGVDFIATGAQPPQAADLLQSPNMDRLFDLLQASYDIVLLDTPPVLAAADAGILAARAGAVFLVARADKTTPDELIASQRAIQQAGGEVKGVLFNGLNVDGRWYRAHYRFGKYRYLNQYGGTGSRQA